MSRIEKLPVTSRLGEITDALLASPSKFLVLTAETAAGKSTTVPQALLGRVPGKILMLEPRRIATVAIASRIADLLGEECGQTAGYRMHLESRTGPETRIEIITEAILTRMLQGDPSLLGVSVVILDEFHERSVHADLALAFLKEAVTLRNDLYVLVMSATIDTERVSAFLGNAPTIHVPGRVHPVDIRYRPPASGRDGRTGSVLERAADAVRSVIENHEGGASGGILVFLPGIYEIRRLEGLLVSVDADVRVLHSSVPFAEQKAILNPPVDGRRRVIISSSIAETSITVPGVTVVIDSGLSRVSRLDVQTGMNTLKTEIESVFSATQRAGRAGRESPGICIRLWAEHDVRLSETLPEIARTDLVPLVLECALWGVSSREGLSWLDPPNAGAWNSARELLVQMGALDASGKVTATGRSISSLGVHPRIAAVALAGSISLAVRFSQNAETERDRKRLAEDLERRLQKGQQLRAGSEAKAASVDDPLTLLSGFPDRLARHIEGGIYQFPSGRLAALSADERKSSAVFPEWIVAPEVDAGEREGKIRSWEPLDEMRAQAWAEAHGIESVEVTFADGTYASGAKLKKASKLRYGKLVLRERHLKPVPGDASAAIVHAVRETGIHILPWDDASRAFLVRALFMAHSPEKTQAKELADSCESWLVPFVPANGALTGELLHEALRYHYDGRKVDSEAPSRITLENGLSRPLVYEEISHGDGPVPILEIRIQELFGCPQTPCIAGVPVLLRLLSPARRPLQITSDLAGFWENTWKEVRKEMKGRYPKHKWPEDPRVKI